MLCVVTSFSLEGRSFRRVFAFGIMLAMSGLASVVAIACVVSGYSAAAGSVGIAGIDKGSGFGSSSSSSCGSSASMSIRSAMLGNCVLLVMLVKSPSFPFCV